MGGAFSYASFSRANGRAGGWGVGQKVGDISQEELAELVSFVPTSLNNGTRIPDFPSAQQRAELVRRTAVFALTPEADKWVTMVSVPAGLDATGRGGNVFTYTSVSRTGTPPRPADVLYAQDIPTPFSIYEVDKVQIPESISARGPLNSDALIDEFLDGEFRYPEKLPAPFKAVTPNPNSAFNRELVSAMAAVLNSRNGFVILVAPDNQAALWIAATAREVGEDGFGFSTFEKAAAINEFPLSTSTMIVVPPSEKQRLADIAISGNPVVFALDAELPDVTSYLSSKNDEATAQPQDAFAASEALEEASKGEETRETAQAPLERDNPWGDNEPADFAAPISEASPFASHSDSSDPFPPNPLDAANPLGMSQEKQQTSSVPDTVSDNPFADAPAATPPVAAQPATAEPAGAQPAPSAGPLGGIEAETQAKETDTVPPHPRANALVPGLTEEERQKLQPFDANWWFTYLDSRRGRSIQLAYLDKSELDGGRDVLLMTAIFASWVYYFPRDFNLLADEALQHWTEEQLEHIAYNTADRFANVIPLDYSQRETYGFVDSVLNAVHRLLQERAVRHQQLQGGPRNPGYGQGLGNGFNNNGF